QRHPPQLDEAGCLRGVLTPSAPQTVLTCDSSQHAQVIGTFQTTGEDYPGANVLLTQSEDLCKSVSLDPRAGLDSTWTYHFSRPSESTWDQGDRTVSCFLSLSEGNVRSSLLPEGDSDDEGDKNDSKSEDEKPKDEESTES